MRPALYGVVLASLLAVTPSPTPPPTEPPPTFPWLSGVASYYDYFQGQAAAGPPLRRALRDLYGYWRGREVEVCRHETCITVRLTDKCDCYGTRLIDLDDADFARLGALSRGLLGVQVRAL